MSRVRASITAVCVSFFFASCSSSQNSTGNPGGSSGGSGGSGGAASSSGGESSGSSGSNSGSGSGGNSGGGSGGNSGGGSGSNSGGGSGGNSGSGSGGNSSSGSGGNSSGGSGSSGSGSGSSSGGSSSGGPVGPVYVTSVQGTYWQTGTLTPVTTGTATLTVNDGTAYQTFNGFGGAFNELGWKYLSQLSMADRTKAMTLLFDATNGAHFMYGRIPIGSSDYASTRYTDDENETDFTNLSNFSITQDKTFLIPYIDAALAINPNIQFWASPWTPPTWMKGADASGGWGMSGSSCTVSGGSTSTSHFDGGQMVAGTNDQNLKALALYFVKWIKAYAALSPAITISELMPQNEPDYAQNYPSCHWDKALYNTFIKTYLGPTFSSNSIGAQIYLGTMSNLQDKYAAENNQVDGDVISAVTADSMSMQFIHGFALQWNMENNAAFTVSAVSSSSLPKWETEHKCGNYPWNPSGFPSYNSTKAPNDWAYGVESWGYIRDWLKAGVTTYSAWNMVLDATGLGNDTCRDWKQDALLVVNGTTLTPTPAYYVFRHVSQYVQQGATRVSTSGGGSMDVLAFKNPDNTHVVIMYNSGGSAVSTTLSMGGKLLQFSVPANGFATAVN